MPQLTAEENDIRENQILDAATELIVHFGYDKTTMSDIAEQAGVTRAIVYLHFQSKEQLFEALLHRETRKYLAAWLAALEADPGSGTIAGVFRGSLSAIRQSPLLSALMKQDRQMFGKYLHKSGNLFAAFQSRSLWPETLKELQAAGAVRQNVQPEVFGYLMNALALGIVEMAAGKAADEAPPFDALLEATTEMLDRALTPEDGGDQAAGKAVIRRLAQSVQAQFEQTKRPAAPAGDRVG